MIDFRYHVVSIIAVFLALATGLVLGASLLNTPLISGLNSANDALVDDKEDLRDQLTEAQAQRDALASSVAALGPFAVRDALAGEEVVLVQLPGADENVAAAVSDAVGQAGGAVTGIVNVRAEWAAAADSAVLDELVARLTQPGVEFVPGDDAYGRAATLLASALVAEGETEVEGTTEETATPPPPPVGVDDEGRVTILEGLREGGFIDVDSAITVADDAIVIGGPNVAEPDERTPTILAAWAAVASALDEVGGAAVLVGPAEAAEEGGLLAAVRADEAAAANVSTVDSVDDPIGPATTVLALSKELAGTNGHYGQVDAANGPVPPFAPAAAG